MGVSSTAPKLGENAAVFEDYINSSEPLVVRNPSREVLTRLTERLSELESDHQPDSITILALDSVLDELSDQFVPKTLLADLVGQNRVTLREYSFSGTAQSNLFVTPTTATAFVPAQSSWHEFHAADETTSESLYDESQRLVEDGTPYDLRTPGVTRIQATMNEEIGEEYTRDFESVFETIQTTRGAADGFDEVHVLLLLAAKHNVLFYDLSRWGEDVGIASKSTFSRRKSDLEDQGILSVAKVPREVGRPRHRLCLAEDELETVDPLELTSIALSAH